MSNVPNDKKPKMDNMTKIGSIIEIMTRIMREIWSNNSNE